MGFASAVFYSNGCHINLQAVNKQGHFCHRVHSTAGLSHDQSTNPATMIPDFF